MNTLAHWITPETMQALSGTLLHFLWQGAALAALLWMLLLSIRSANARYVASVIVLLLMLVAPAITFLTLSSSGGDTAEVSGYWLASSDSKAVATSLPPSPNTDVAAEMSVAPWLVEAWLIGVVALSVRSAGGLLLLGRLRRNSARPLDTTLRSTCLALQNRLGLQRLIEFCESREISAPAVVGWFRPVVLLPVAALAGLSQQQLEAVIAHELAHIKRLDAFVNAFQIFVETVLFYHPAVWWVSHRIRIEREHCCDDVAVAVCGDRLVYARALTAMEGFRMSPRLALAANATSLSGRIRRLLGMETFRSTRAVGVAVGLFCLGVAMVASTALVDIAPKVSAAAPMPFVVEQSQADPRPAPQSDPKPSAAVKARARVETSEETRTVVIAQTNEETSTSGSYIDGMKAAGLDHLSVDELVAFKIQGVTPEYVREMKAAGVQPTPDQLIALKVQDVTPEYVREMKSLGQETDANNLIAMKVQDITPEYVRAMQASGLNLDTGKLIGMKVQDVTPEYIQQLRSLGFTPTADEVISMKVQDLTPEYVRDMRATGLNPSVNQLISLKVQDVTPEYVKSLQQLGLKLTADQFIAAKVQDITPEFVERAQRHGFHDLTLDKLIQLKNLNIVSDRAQL